MECIVLLVVITGTEGLSYFWILFVDGIIIWGGLSKTGSKTDEIGGGAIFDGTVDSLGGTAVGIVCVEQAEAIDKGGIIGACCGIGNGWLYFSGWGTEFTVLFITGNPSFASAKWNKRINKSKVTIFSIVCNSETNTYWL